VEAQLKIYDDAPDIPFGYDKFHKVMKKIEKEKGVKLEKLRDDLYDKKGGYCCRFIKIGPWLRKKTVKASFNELTA